jgi:hypothetical protein
MVHFSCLVKKDHVKPVVHVAETKPFVVPFKIGLQPSAATQMANPPAPSKVELAATKVPLVDLCVARSGDKGDSANIGVIVRDPRHYDWLKTVLTEKTVRDRMGHLMQKGGVVKRYELPGSFALNFLLTRCLGGGGLSSLNVDRQGKTYAQILLSMEVYPPKNFHKSARL